jgi:hypothetical protein
MKMQKEMPLKNFVIQKKGKNLQEIIFFRIFAN